MKIKTIKRSASRRGATMFIVILTMVILGMIATTFFFRNSVDLAITRNFKQSNDSFYHSDAGVEYVLERIKSDLTAGNVGLTEGTENVYYSAPSGWQFEPVTTLTRLPDGKSYYFQVTGHEQDARTKIEAVVRRPPGSGGRMFDYDLFGDDQITFSGNSWAVGDIRGNNNITVTGPVTGDCIPGPGCSVSNPGVVSGDTTPATSNYTPPPIPPADIAAAAASNDNNLINPSYVESGPKLRKSGGTLTLTTGTYYFTEVTFSGGAQLIINGQVEIYCTGKWTMSGGGIANPNMNPNDLIVWNSSTEKITVSGTSQSYGHFYAPSGKEIVVSGGGTYYGALICGGGKVTFSGGSNYGGSGGGAPVDDLEVVYWRQIFD